MAGNWRVLVGEILVLYHCLSFIFVIKKNMIKHVLLGSLFILISSQIAKAQIAKTSPLYIELKLQDSVFFERGFNQCDIAYLDTVISMDLKFFHDQGGFQNREEFFERTKKNICGDLANKPFRKLEPGSLEVFPLYNNGRLYGAIQSGIHNFYKKEPGKEDRMTGTARFTSVWLLRNNNWELSEVLSYDHQEPKSGGK